MKNSYRYRFVLFLAAGFGVFALSGELLAEDISGGQYIQRETFADTLRDSLQASQKVVVSEWRQVGPFDSILRRPQPPEEDSGEGKEYALYGGGKGVWQVADYADGFINRIEPGGWDTKILDKQPTLYLRRVLHSPEEHSLRVFFGCDAPFRVLLNGRDEHYAGAVHQLEPGQESVLLPMRKGENVLLVKIHLTRQPLRFFFLPDWGADFTTALIDRLARDFPERGEPPRDYRRRAERSSTLAEERYYRLVELPGPEGAVLEGTGLDMMENGSLALSTRRGFVYMVDNPAAEDLGQVHFRRFASGMHDCLGLKVVDGRIVVVNRGELTRLSDVDGDGRADRQESLSNAWGITGNYHEYAYGLEQDRRGNYHIALNLTFASGGPSSDVPYRGCVVRVTPEGELQPVACGLRSPNGVGSNSEGDIFVTDNQGDWVPACGLYHVRAGDFLGHPASFHWIREIRERLVKEKESGEDVSEIPAANFLVEGEPAAVRSLPAVWFPYEELCQSATDIVQDNSDGKFGPFAGQLFVGEMTKGLVARVQLEKVGGEYQGTCFLFRRGCGAANRLAIDSQGKMYITRVNRGWGGGGLGDGLARMDWTGVMPFEMHDVHLLSDGFEISFTQPLADGIGEDLASYGAEQFGYQYWSTYGSPKIDLRRLKVLSVEVSRDRRRVRVRLEGLEPGKVCRLALTDFRSAEGELLLHPEAFYTVRKLATEK